MMWHCSAHLCFASADNAFWHRASASASILEVTLYCRSSAAAAFCLCDECVNSDTHKRLIVAHAQTRKEKALRAPKELCCRFCFPLALAGDQAHALVAPLLEPHAQVLTTADTDLMSVLFDI